MKPIVLVFTCLLLRPAMAGGCSIPLEPSGASFVVSVTIDDRSGYRFLFDTGASMTVVAEEVAGRLGIAPRGTVGALTTSGAVRAGSGMLRELRVGSVTLRNLPILTMPLPRFPTHGALDGILGMDIVEGRSFLLDVGRRCLELDAPEPAGTSLEAESVASRVAVKAGGLSLVIDSGASFLVLMSERARSRSVREGRAEVATASRQFASGAALLPRLDVGDVVLRNVPAAFAPSTGDPREDGLLPVAAFRAIYVDAARSKVIFR